MKMIIVALALVAMATAAPVDNVKEPQKILRSEFDQQPDGGYVFSYETEDGISHSETGVVKEVLDEEKKPHNVVVVRGTFSYPTIDDKVETINYIADETGFHPEGNSIPKPVSSR